MGANGFDWAMFLSNSASEKSVGSVIKPTQPVSAKSTYKVAA